MNIKEKAFSAVRWTTFVTSARVGLQTLQLIVLARLILPQDFGLMAMIITVTAFIQIFSDLGINNSIIQAKQISKPALSALYWFNLLTGLLLSALVSIAAPWIADFYNEPNLTTPLTVSSFSFILLALGQQVKVLTEKRLDFRSIAIAELTSAIVSTIVTITTAFYGLGVYALVLGVLTLTGGNSLLYILIARNGWAPSFKLNITEAATHVRTGIYLLGTSLANTATVQLDIIIVGRMLGSAALGAYSVPREFCLKAMYATNPIITRVGTPLIAQAQDDKGLLKSVYLSTIRMTSSINFPLYASIALFHEQVTWVIFGEKWMGSAGLLAILAIWGMFRSLGSPVGILLYGTGKAKLALAQSLSVTILIIPTTLLGTYWGLEGVSIALTIFYFAFVSAIWLIVVRPITGATFGAYSEQWLRPFLTTLVACAVAAPVLLTSWPPLVVLIVGLLIGGGVYVATSWFVNRSWCQAMMGLVGVEKIKNKFFGARSAPVSPSRSDDD